jgi:hypothetical protein
VLTGFDLCRAAMAVTGVSAPEQSVLNVLAVMANDVAQAWPPIAGPAGLCAKTKLSERAVQRAIQALVSAEHITRAERIGHGVVYTVHPRLTVTPATETPRQPDTPVSVTPTPATVAPKQPRTTITSTEASPPSRPRPAPERRKHRLPMGWVAKPLVGVTAEIVQRWEVGRLERVLDSFENYHRGKGTVMIDWDAAWRTWVANEEKFEGRTTQNGRSRQNGRSPRGDDAGDAIFAARRRLGIDG